MKSVLVKNHPLSFEEAEKYFYTHNLDRTKWKAYLIKDICFCRCKEMYVHDQGRMKYIMEHSIMDKDGKIYWIDVCKGIGILFVVLGHIARGYDGAGIFPEYTRVLVTAGNFAYVFHMTLLFILSGYVFYRSYAVGGQPKNVHYVRKLMN